MEEKNMDKERLAALTGNPDETQIVSLKDLEELEYLQLTEGDKDSPAAVRRAVPLGLIMGLLAALCVAAVLTALYVHHEARPVAFHSAPQESRRQ